MQTHGDYFKLVSSTCMKYDSMVCDCIGPCNNEKLIFEPPNAPIITSNGSLVLGANSVSGKISSKRVLSNPIATIIHKYVSRIDIELGDGTCSFLVQLNRCVQQLQMFQLENGHNTHAIRKCLNKIKCFWDLDMFKDTLTKYNMLHSINVNDKLNAKIHGILITSMAGNFNSSVVQYLCDLLTDWVTRSSENKAFSSFKEFQEILRALLSCFDTLVIQIPRGSLDSSHLLPLDCFLIQKKIVPQHQKLIQSMQNSTVHWVALLSSLDDATPLSKTTMEIKTSEEFLSYMKYSTTSRYTEAIKQISKHDISLIITSEPLNDSTIEICEAYGIAVVENVEKDDILCMCSRYNIHPLVDVFNEAIKPSNIGCASKGIIPCNISGIEMIKLQGVLSSSDISSHQMILHGETKGICQQYKNQIKRGLRVLISWMDTSHSFSHFIPGGGSFEFLMHFIFSNLSLDKKKTTYEQHILGAISQSFLSTPFNIFKNVSRQLNQTHVDTKSHKQFLEHVIIQKERFQNHQLIYGYNYVEGSFDEGNSCVLNLPHIELTNTLEGGIFHPLERVVKSFYFMIDCLECLYGIDGILAISRSKPLGNKNHNDSADES